MNKKLLFFMTIVIFSVFSAWSVPFNEKLTDEEKAVIASGEVYIKNINFHKNMSLNRGNTTLGDKLIDEIHDLNPKYLAEVFQIKPYKGNEDLPQRLEAILNNVPDYA